ncbi:iron ABC transporter permease [Oscillatoria amoena NRMC-F 0135]|nr:iron ABC transporter permease [Oscillatoria laete-virens]MDL5047232.1 iron ABC transporter permease [Oscillatoria amoena NRMC-F 0135]MDL5052538.1 iron ABC transporter permease [Oscillatoria laete-virens NRMC-F 0139]
MKLFQSSFFPLPLILGMILLASVFVSVAVGYGDWGGIPDTWNMLWRWLSGRSPGAHEEILRTVFIHLRLPRILLEIFVGANLAVAGVLLQALFRNPLAEPYSVGVSSGAALGAVIAVTIGFRETFTGIGLQSLTAFAGALLVTFVVYSVARQNGVVQTTRLLLTGLAVAAVIQAATTLMLLQFEFIRLRSVLSWTLGSFSNKGWSHVVMIAPFSLMGITICLLLAKPMNILCLGEDKAKSLGLSVEKFKMIVFILAALLTGTAVAVSGIIAFVGLVVPHIMRMITGPDHRRLIPAAALGGGLLVLYADLIVRFLSKTQEIPIGVVTSVFGGVMFIHLLKHSRQNLS